MSLLNIFGLIKSEKDTELALIERAKHEDKKAFAELYAPYAQPLYEYAYVMTGDQDSSFELVKQVFLKAWDKLPLYKADRIRFVLWLYTIARGMVIARFRKKKQEETKTVKNTDPLISLPFGEKESIIFAIILGLSTSDIVKIVGKSAGAIRVLKFRGLKRLRKEAV